MWTERGNRGRCGLILKRGEIRKGFLELMSFSLGT